MEFNCIDIAAGVLGLLADRGAVAALCAFGVFTFWGGYGYGSRRGR